MKIGNMMQTTNTDLYKSPSAVKRPRLHGSPMLYLGARAKITVAGISATMAWYIYAQIYFLLQIDDGGQVSQTAWQTYTDNSTIARLIGLASAFCYLFWSLRAYANAKSYLQLPGGGSLAIWGWLLPFANLFLPCIVLSRIMKASYLYQSLPNRQWLVLIWWLPLLTFAVLQRLSTKVDNINDFTTITIGLVFTYLVSGITLIYCVVRSTQSQHKCIDDLPSILDDHSWNSTEDENQIALSPMEKMTSTRRQLEDTIATIRKEKYVMFFAVFIPVAALSIWSQFRGRTESTPADLNDAEALGEYIGSMLSVIILPTILASPALLYGLKARPYRRRLQELKDNQSFESAELSDRDG